MSKGIIVASFGTSYADAARSLINIEESIQKAYPDLMVLRAWTSGFIRRKIEKRDGVHIYDVAEALDVMLARGITDVVVQPTHIIAGMEYDKIVEACQPYMDKFASLKIGKVLLSAPEDYDHAVAAIQTHIPVETDEYLLLMGHGSEHAANECYNRMNTTFTSHQATNLFMATVEGSPDITDALDAVSAVAPARVVLAPFLMVAGDHANNDLAGDEEDSWKSIMESKGFTTRSVLCGLGEYKAFRELILAHLAECMKNK